MNLDSIPVLALVQRSIGWLGRNHDVLAQNIANADTPGYRARELKPLDFAALVARPLQPVKVAVTSPGHLRPTRVPAGGDVRESRDPYEVSSTGNSVSLEQQAVKIASNAMNYQLAITLYGKSIGLLRAAIAQRR
jgi:flagellar basal-body rod protein FlgB